MLRRSAVLRTLIFIFAISFVATGTAQDTVLTVTYKGKLDSIHSAILHQTRLVQVFLPPDYKPGDPEKYDVIYVLDGGNWNTGLLTRIQHFIEDNEQMPPTIVVSVMGIDRNVELTPTHLDLWQAPTGGAEKFLGYLKNELIPYINKTYPSNGQNTLFGHSLGGMFVLYAMMTEPTAFRSYIAADPSVWWDNGFVARMASTKLPNLAGSDITLYISGRLGAEFHDMRIDTMETVLKQWAPKNLHWQVVAYPKETHSSVRLKTMYDGLKFTYAGFTKHISFMPANGTILKDKPYIVTFYADTSDVFYSTDSTTPIRSSAQVQRLTKLIGPARLTYKLFSNRSNYDQMYSGTFAVGDPPGSVHKPKSAKPGGFYYAYYEAAPGSWPDLKKAKPARTGITSKGFDSALTKKTNYILLVGGVMEIKEEGYYTFFLRGEAGSTLSVGGKTLMSLNDKNKDDGSYMVYLSNGFYRLHIEQRDKKGQFSLLLYYMTPTSTLIVDAGPIPAEAQFSTGKK